MHLPLAPPRDHIAGALVNRSAVPGGQIAPAGADWQDRNPARGNPQAVIRTPLLTLTALAALLACHHDVHDDDGGRLMADEEERVKEWVHEIVPVIQQVSEIERLDALSNPDPLLATMRRLERTRPPLVQDNQAGRAMRDLHGALARQAELFIEFIEHAPTSQTSPMALFLFLDDFMKRLEELELTANSLSRLALEFSQVVATDFRDDPQFQSELQMTVQMVSQLFSTGWGRPQRTLPSMTPPGGTQRAGSPFGFSQGYNRQLPP